MAQSVWLAWQFWARCASQKTHRVFFDSRNVQKCATKSDTSGHCLACSNKLVFGRSAATFCNTYPFREPKVFMLCTFWDMMTRTRTCFLACETKFHGFHENLLQTKAAIIAWLNISNFHWSLSKNKIPELSLCCIIFSSLCCIILTAVDSFSNPNTP